MDTGFETEAFKLMISDITASEAFDDVSFLVKLSTNEFPGTGKKTLPLSVKMIWIQGTITRIILEDDEKVIVMNDGTGEAKILYYETVPGGDSPIVPGTYIGILGQILMSKPLVEIKAVKVMCLNQKPLLESMWDEEVKDLKAFLLGLTDPIL